ncbi:hypothetical protein LQZ21_07175 [Treponema sp. TIM-1]|uniref:hypothetical protein n=1 Tax=Treponema sp. TIM-1 TaxID=2898417 RepID=UPI0039809E74
MSRKSLFWLPLTMLLAVLLVLSGCPSGTGGDTTTSQSPPYNPNPTPTPSPSIPRPQTVTVDPSDPPEPSEINSALNSSASSVILSSAGGAATVEVDSGESLTVPLGKGLTIGNNVTLAVVNDTGTVTVNGDLTVASGGAFDLSDLTTSATDKIAISGTVTVKAGGTYKAAVQGSGTTDAPQFDFGPNGKIVLEYGSEAYLNPSGTPILYLGASGDNPMYAWDTTGRVELSQVSPGVSLLTVTSGNIKVLGISNLGIIYNGIINAGAKVTIEASDGLLVTGTLTVNGAIDASGGKIVGSGSPNSTITFGSTAPTGTYVNNTSGNFYYSGTQEAAQPDKTYTWNGTTSRWERS